MADELNCAANDTNAPAVVCVVLPDVTGAEHKVTIDAADWERAKALNVGWQVTHHYERPLVVSTAYRAVKHPQRDWKNQWLLLANLVMTPPYRHTVRHLNGDTLNLTRRNLVVRPKGSPTVPKPLSAAAEARQDRQNAKVALLVADTSEGETFRVELQRRDEARMDKKNPNWREEWKKLVDDGRECEPAPKRRLRKRRPWAKAARVAAQQASGNAAQGQPDAD